MKKIRKLIQALMVFAFALVAMLPLALSDDIGANVTVIEDCGISVDTTPIAFESVSPDSTSATNSRDVTNTGGSGQAECRYELSGTDWAGPAAMESEATGYKCTDAAGVDCDADGPGFTTLTNAGVDFLGLDAETTAGTDLQVTIPANQLSGFYTQTITVTLVD